MECGTPDKPEVHALALELKIPRAEVLGCLFLVWRWFDQQTEDGQARVTLETLDVYTARPGFAAAMAKVGWLKQAAGGLVALPNFDRHNGKTAKKRAVTAKRQAKFRNASVTP